MGKREGRLAKQTLLGDDVMGGYKVKDFGDANNFRNHQHPPVLRTAPKAHGCHDQDQNENCVPQVLDWHCFLH